MNPWELVLGHYRIVNKCTIAKKSPFFDQYSWQPRVIGNILAIKLLKYCQKYVPYQFSSQLNVKKSKADILFLINILEQYLGKTIDFCKIVGKILWMLVSII